jgi:hypothetical protein
MDIWTKPMEFDASFVGVEKVYLDSVYHHMDTIKENGGIWDSYRMAWYLFKPTEQQLKNVLSCYIRHPHYFGGIVYVHIIPQKVVEKIEKQIIKKDFL